MAGSLLPNTFYQFTVYLANDVGVWSSRAINVSTSPLIRGLFSYDWLYNLLPMCIDIPVLKNNKFLNTRVQLSASHPIDKM